MTYSMASYKAITWRSQPRSVCTYSFFATELPTFPCCYRDTLQAIPWSNSRLGSVCLRFSSPLLSMPTFICLSFTSHPTLVAPTIGCLYLLARARDSQAHFWIPCRSIQNEPDLVFWARLMEGFSSRFFVDCATFQYIHIFYWERKSWLNSWLVGRCRPSYL